MLPVAFARFIAASTAFSGRSDTGNALPTSASENPGRLATMIWIE